MRKPKGPIPQNPVLPERPVWSTLFGRPTLALHLEIGSGHGGFALAFAAANPQADFVAMEWREKFADNIRGRAADRGLRNLLVLRADARVEVPRLFGEASLDAVHLQFPDPWWKRRHQKRRVIDETFAALLLSRLKSGGVFDVRTDVEERGVEMRETLEAAGFVNTAGAGAFSPRPEGEIPSTREKRYLAEALPVYRLQLQKPPNA